MSEHAHYDKSGMWIDANGVRMAPPRDKWRRLGRMIWTDPTVRVKRK